MSVPRVAAVVAIVAAIGAAIWFVRKPADEPTLVRQRLDSFADLINKSTVDGAGMAARAAELSAYLTEDVEVEFGVGSPPIRGRETIVGMADRLQPRTAAFRLRFEDVMVALKPTGDAASVHLTAEIIRRSITTGEESLDAREFSLEMRRVGGDWKIARVTAVQTLKQAP